jgi:phosphoglucomutase
LAAEITAVTGRDPGEHYASLTEKYGAPVYTRIDVPTTPEQKGRLSKLNAETMTATTLAGDPVTSILTHAPANNAAIGGVKVNTANGWFAARPSGTENIYKIYAESFQGQEHLDAIVAQAQDIVTAAVS